MKHIFIVNPTSGNGAGKKAITEIEEIAKEKNLEYEIKITKYPRHAEEIANLYSIKDDVCLYSVGGDGTAYEVLNGLNDKVCFSIIPCGSGNDFYRLIDSKPAKDLRQRIIDTIDGKIVYVDYGISNHNRFLNCTTFGFDADINHVANTTMKQRHIPSSMLYVAATVSKMIKIPQSHAIITIDGKVIEQDVLMCAVMNGQFYGGGFNPTPDADIQDGYFDICIVQPLSRLDIVRLVGKYAKGKHTNLKECTMLKGKSITIQLDNSAIMQSDGEEFNEKKITLELMHHGLKMKVPQHSTLK